MNGTLEIDLAHETALAGHEIALIALAATLALAFLFRGLLRRRRGAAPVCNSCPGCTSGRPCKALSFDLGTETNSKTER